MQNKEFNDITLQRYLDGDMTEQERKAFEQNIAQNEGLKNEVETYKTLAEGIAYQGRKAAWEKVQALEREAEERQTPVKPIGKNRVWYAVAASVALLIAAYFIFFDSNQDTEELFAEYFEPYPALAYAPTRSDTTLANLQEEAFNAYSNGFYREAIPIFKKILTDGEDPVMLFYLGNAYLAENQPEEAIVALETASTFDIEIKTQVRWFLALSYLANKDEGSAKTVLEKLAIGGSLYQSKAETILSNLK